MDTVHRESNAHYYAKLAVENWFTGRYQWNKKNNYNNVLYIFDWQPAADDPQCGVRREYPLLSKALQNGNKDILGVTVWDKYPDLNQDNLTAKGLKLEAVIDIVVCSNGRIKYGLEIVHKHRCTQTKIDFLKSLKSHAVDFTVYEISAEWILSQMYGKIPPRMPLERVT